MDTKLIARFVGISLLIVAALMAVSCAVAYSTRGDGSRFPLLLSALLTGIVGVFPLFFVRPSQRRLTIREGNLIVVASWMVSCLFGMLPFLFFGGEFTFVNALFESISGFTTTGASILVDIEALPRGLQFWRISTAWVGGIGIVTLFSRLLGSDMDRTMLTKTEISNVARESVYTERSELFANKMLVTYIALTLIATAALKLSGLGWFEAATTAMSACSTCGFCTRNASIASFMNPGAEVILIVTMLLASINFNLLFASVIRRGQGGPGKSEVTRAYLVSVGVVVAVVAFILSVSGQYSSLPVSLRYAAFQVISLTSTTGFATADTTLWPMACVALLVLCSFVCGCSGSTSGGLKMDRALLAAKGIRQEVQTNVHATWVRVVRIDGHLRDKQAKGAITFVACYMVFIVVFAVINMMGGLDFETGVTASIACMGNVGPGFGDVGSMGNYAGIPDFLKLTSCMEMMIGRLEIFPFLYAFHSFRR